MTNHLDILKQATAILGERGVRYGSVEDTFERCATIATAMLGRQVTPYDLCIIMTAMKMARIATARTHEDNYVAGINYLSFAAQFSTAEEQVKVALEEDIAAMARKFAPRRVEEEQAEVAAPAKTEK